MLCSPNTAELVMAETLPLTMAYRFAASLNCVALAPGSVVVVNSEVAPVLSGSPVACPSATVFRSDELAAASQKPIVLLAGNRCADTRRQPRLPTLAHYGLPSRPDGDWPSPGSGVGGRPA